MPSLSSRLLGTIVIAVASICVATWFGLHTEQVQPPAPQGTASPQPGSAPLARSESKLRAHDGEPMAMAVVPSADKAHAARTTLIEQLKASGKPQDAFQAYQLVAYCVQARMRGKLTQTLPLGPETKYLREALELQQKQDVDACDGISDALIRDRLADLDRAAKAHVAGSAFAFLQEGPFGDSNALEQRPDDPLVLAWKEQAIGLLKSSAELGDETAITALMQLYDKGGTVVARDQEKALTYWIVEMEIAKLRRGGATQSMEAALAVVRQGLTAQQAASATAGGQKLFNECCTKPTALPS